MLAQALASITDKNVCSMLALPRFSYTPTLRISSASSGVRGVVQRVFEDDEAIAGHRLLAAVMS
jgi:hypothetical protein